MSKRQKRNVKSETTSYYGARQGRQSSILQEESEAEEHAAEQNGHARCSTGNECARGRATLVASSGGGLGSTSEAGDGDLVCGRTRGGLCGGHCAQERRVAEEGRLCTTGVVLGACRLACVVAVAVVAALLAPCLAHEEGESLRVLGDVGDNAVLADTRVCELIRVARVLVGGHRGHAGLLETDEGALGLVLLAPVVSVRRGNGIWVDAVGVVEAGLGSDQAGRSSNAEGEGGGTHGSGGGGV
jgi:hypothetical protein